MPNSENDRAVELEILKQRIENHREYISRQWQYYATFILLNGLVINAAITDGSIHTFSPAVKVLGLALVIASGVFFHLISWTNVRIHRNAARINQLAGEEFIEIPNARTGITLWLLVSVTGFTLGWLIWIFSVSLKFGLLSTISFVFIVANSLLSSRKLEPRR